MLTAVLDGIGLLISNPIPISIITLALGGIFIPALSISTKKTQKNISFPTYLLFVWFSLSLLLRLAYIQELAVPLYFDSAEHARIITAISNGAPINNIIPRYYHIGYHLLAAGFTQILALRIPDIMLIFGQIILALLPVPIFIIIWHETTSRSAALFSAILAGFAWSMPGFAVNWGKYPMLIGLLFSSTALLYVFRLKDSHRTKRIILLIGGILSTLIHSRMLIVFGITALSWIAAQKITRNRPKHQRIALGFGLVTALLFGMLISNNVLLNLALEPYTNPPNLYITIFIAALIPFAYQHSRKFFFFNLILLNGLLASLFIPISGAPLGFGQLTLLDRPFVETALSFPLAMIGGLGLAGITKIIRLPQQIQKERLLLLLVSGFALYTLSIYDFYPSPCCNFVSNDDIHVMTWIERNSQPNATILIAAEPMSVMPNQTAKDLIGTDAGVWVNNITQRKTLKLLYSRDFSDRDLFISLCERGINYIYAGNQPSSFNTSLHKNQNDWYQEVLTLPKIRIFSLTDCPN